MNRKPYLEYKESGVEWLGQVPGHWEVKRLKFSFPKLYSGVSVNSESSPADQESAGVMKTSCVYGNQFIPTENKRVVDEEIERVACSVTADSLIVSRMNTPELVGNCGYVESDYPNLFLPDRLWIARFSKCQGLYGKYAWYFCISDGIGKLTGALATGTSGSMKNLSQDAFLNIDAIVPPLPEQTAIADFLDRETGRIDTLVAKKRRLIALLGEKRTALISRTVTRGLPADAAREFGLEPHTRFKDSGIEWLAEVPEGWEALSLRRLIKYVKTGTTPSGAEEYHFESGGFNWYSPSDFSDAVFLGVANRALSAEGRAEVRIFPERTVMLVGIGATIGKVGLSANESSCNQQINAIICNGKLNPIFATYYLKTMRDFIVKCGKFTTMAIINQDETKNLIFTVPPIPEQTAIVTYLDRETVKIDQLVTKVEAAIARLQEYRTALITAAVTGKIDVRPRETP